MAASRPSADDLLKALAATAAEEMERVGTPGIAIGVQVGDDVATTGLGVTSVQHPRPVGPDTMFRICSVTKPFTTTLAYVLAGRDLLDLDAPLRTLLPDLRLQPHDLVDVLTPRHLMLHTSGLECELPTNLEGYGRDHDALFAMLADYESLRHLAPVGRIWGYCNAGYWLLGAVIARAAGTSFEAAMDEHLLAPLGIQTTTAFADEAIMGAVALPHRPCQDGATDHVLMPPFRYPRARVPSGGLISSVVDLLAFARVHLGHPIGRQLLDEAALADLQRPVVAAHVDAVRQSPGWLVEAAGGRRVLHHRGGYSGYKSSLMCFPEDDVAVAVLTNSAAAKPTVAALEATARDVLCGPAQRSAPPREERAVDIDRFEGRYAFPTIGHLDVAAADGGLAVSFGDHRGGRTHWRFEPRSATAFVRAGQDPVDPDLVFLPDVTPGAMHLRLDLRLGARVRTESPRV